MDDHQIVIAAMSDLYIPQDIGVPCMVYLALTLWPLGEVAHARHLAEEAVRYAPSTGHLATAACALNPYMPFTRFSVSLQRRGDPIKIA
jgi:hypothetical protein